MCEHGERKRLCQGIVGMKRGRFGDRKGIETCRFRRYKKDWSWTAHVRTKTGQQKKIQLCDASSDLLRGGNRRKEVEDNLRFMILGLCILSSFP